MPPANAAHASRSTKKNLSQSWYTKKSRVTPAGMRQTTRAEATLPVLTRSWRSLARNASSNPGWDVILSLGMVRLANFEEQIHPRQVRAHRDRIPAGALRLQGLKLPACPIHQVPVQQVLHSIAQRIRWLDICHEQQTTGSHP